ncbi:hypothetical protein V6N13_066462 [Hibiscus sabdariffa]|uniref:Uncharacterized protein n=1 Tax=Hibiscus sabdariffa TaxID=183260 RepID=A0ABR2DS24_9ROSI
MKKNDDSDVQKPESWRLSCQTIVGNKENSGKLAPIHSPNVAVFAITGHFSAPLIPNRFPATSNPFLELLIYPRICCRTVIRTRKIPGEKVSVVSAELRSV